MAEKIPFAVHANHAELPPGAIITQPQVESRLALWCRGGRGTIRVNGVKHILEPMDYLFLPWGADLQYRSDPAETLRLSGIHLIPALTTDGTTNYRVRYGDDPPIDNRHDTPLGELGDFHRFRVDATSPLFLISEFIISYFQRGNLIDDRVARLSLELVAELQTAATSDAGAAGLMPLELHEMIRYLQQNLGAPITAADMAQRLDCSESKVRRLFSTWTGHSPVEWINRTRIERARCLLTTTRRPVGTIARSVGFEDQFYFSRLFKRHIGIAPLAYRKTGSLL